MTDELPEIRKGHPYIMYEMLKDSENAIEKAYNDVKKVEVSYENGNLTITGNGTSYHAGYIGSLFNGGKRKVQRIQSYELNNYSKPEKNIIAISHTGKTKTTVDTFRIFNDRLRIGITHDKSSPLYKEADIPIFINDKDLSLCNTKAFFDNVVSTAYLMSLYDEPEDKIENYKNRLKNELRKGEDFAKKAVDEIEDEIKNIFVLGAGNNYISARETAQKIKEATHIHAEGIELEEYNHGCTSTTDKNTLIIIIGNEIDRKRSASIIKGIRRVGASSITINGEGDINVDMDTNYPWEVPILSMPYMYYTAYYLALKVGVNPDILRLDEKEYYDFDMDIFPPGEH
ncbi:SIS domain-containing protein [Caldiplasma sukawensis]